jgi:hypothetical protein
MIASPFLVGRDRYERVMEGWVDNTHEDAFTHTVRITDDDCSVELSAVCTPSPAYEVREARARILAGAVDASTVTGISELGGTRMVAGFTRRMAELCGSGAGAGRFVEAGVEVARLARQVSKLPREMVAGFDPRDARRCWELDMTGWVDLPNSCFTYSDAGKSLLGTRVVSIPMNAQLYAAAPGAAKIFVRRKRYRLVLTERRLHLFHSMHDNVHGFDLHYEVDLDSERIVAADSITSRLPYQGICNEPQQRIATMVGQAADVSLGRQIQTSIGGMTGCAQLYDLTSDLLRLLVFS